METNVDRQLQILRSNVRVAETKKIERSKDSKGGFNLGPQAREKNVSVCAAKGRIRIGRRRNTDYTRIAARFCLQSAERKIIVTRFGKRDAKEQSSKRTNRFSCFNSLAGVKNSHNAVVFHEARKLARFPRLSEKQMVPFASCHDSSSVVLPRK